MKRNLHDSTLILVMGTAMASFVVALVVGLWALVDGSSAGALIGRSVVALFVVLGVAFALALWLGRALSRSVEEIGKAVAMLRQEKYTFVPRPALPQELVEIGSQLYELGIESEERERSTHSRGVTDARELRQEALRRFGHGVVREIQKSLAGVLGYTEISLKQPGVEGQLKTYLTLLEQEARVGREILERILRYVREEPFAMGKVDANAVIEESAKPFIDAKDAVHIQLKLSRELPRVQADAAALRFVLSTLVANGRDAMLPKGGSLELSSTLDQNGWVVVMVKDTGAGIRDEDQIRIFTPFYTTKGNQKGAGLDLAIASRVMQLHGGKLEFWSRYGIGTVFFASLPAAK